MTTLSNEQQIAFDKFKRGDNLFITGPGGTGKTMLIQTFVNHLQNTGMNYQVCAMTGCASLLLRANARTIHSWSGIKTAKGNRAYIISSVVNNKNYKMAWKKVKVLIIDEVSMMSKKIFEILDDIGKIIHSSNRPFGGIQVIFTGDFYQLPPVGNADDPDTTQFCFESEKWERTFAMENHIQLKTMFRQTDPTYIDILNQIRIGQLSESGKTILREYVNRNYIASDHNECMPTKLFPVRYKADMVNQSMFSKIEGAIHTFDSIILSECTTYLETGQSLPSKYLQQNITVPQKEYEINNLYTSSQCPKKLELKIGSLVMATVNIDLEGGICNGSQGIVVGFVSSNIPSKDYPIVKFSNGSTRTVECHYWQSEEYPRIAIGQIPLCLAWAMTIHKIQGATLAMAEIDIGNTVFEYGQTYVALSRIQSLDGLYLTAFHPHRIKANPIVTRFYSTIPDIADISSTEDEKSLDQSDSIKKIVL
jgi:ATP-dependent DNA helicase PIF1